MNTQHQSPLLSKRQNRRPGLPSARYRNPEITAKKALCAAAFMVLAVAADLSAAEPRQVNAIKALQVVAGEHPALPAGDHIGEEAGDGTVAVEDAISFLRPTASTTLYSPYLEWQVDNPSWEGNPFDVVATVTFSHDGSSQQHVTEMFYAGGTTWKYRFTGTHTGDWTYTTVSDDPELDGLSGSLHVDPQTDPNIRGFLDNAGNKYVLPDHSGTPRGYLFNIFMPRPMAGYDYDWEQYGIDANRTDLIEQTIENGFDTIFPPFCWANEVLSLGAVTYTDHNSNEPDLETFAIIESLIVEAHQRGIRLHFWAWGDEQRKWTPVGLPGGINGWVDQRLQRYIAARLGPLPGWSLGYGFDLQEWVNESQLEAWAQYLHDHLGWRHMLWGRGRSNAELDVVSYSGYQVRSYNQIVADLNSDTTRPHLYEERHLYLRNADLDMDGTRRFLWHNTLAGGMGGFWGPLWWSSSLNYPHPEQFRTHYDFWEEHKRFLVSMEPVNSAAGQALSASNSDHAVFYMEDGDSLSVDLSTMSQAVPVIAVDTKADYEEVDLGTRSPGQHTLELPYASDWAIAAGSF